MRSPFYFIVRPVGGSRYNNTKNVGGIDLVVSASEEDHKTSNRYAEVIEVPTDHDGTIRKGDTLLVHHNVFKFYNDIKGRRKSGRSFIMDDRFLLEPDQFFMFKRDGEWYPYDRYCFVEPVPPTESYIFKPITEEPLMARMVYPNEYLMRNGVMAGDTVCFTPDSEYEFDVDGRKLYRMFDHQITMKLN
jgi:hypothetical protein